MVLKEGDRIALTKKVRERQTYEYADASGDHNLIHVDEDFAKSAGFKGVILQGLCTMAFVAQSLTDAQGDPASLKKLRVRFSGVVYPGDEIKVKGEVKKIEGGKAEVEIFAENQNGEKVITRGLSILEV